MPTIQSEAFSRVLIDKALEYSGWNLLDPKQVRFEYHKIRARVARVGCVERSETHQWTADGYDGFRLLPLPILLAGRPPTL